MAELVVNRKLTIPAAELKESFARSGGPGGQHVNKTSSKVLLRWNLAGSKALSPEDRDWLLLRLGSQLSQEGELIISSERFRDQSRNRQDARDKLAALVASALVRPKRRRRGSPPRKAAANRLKAKKQRSELKSMRRRRDD